MIEDILRKDGSHMDSEKIIRWYSDKIWESLPEHPDRAAKRLRAGMRAEKLRCAHFQPKCIPAPYRYLRYMADCDVVDALSHPEHCAWTNIFAPVELLQTFGLGCISMEALSSFLSGFYLEDRLIDYTEAQGISQTLCSYHKNFLAAADTGLVPTPVLGVTTSMVCDANICSFRYLHEHCKIDAFVLDVPYVWTQENEDYLVHQLRELITLLEKKTGRKYDEDALRETLRCENEARAFLKAFLEKRAVRAYPNEITLVLFLLFATHLDIGRPWVRDCFRQMSEDIDRYPLSDEKRIFWVHLTPYAEPTLRERLNYRDDIAVCCDDFNLDYMDELDTVHPLNALAKKMIGNIYNGPFTRKADACCDYMQRYNCDAAIELCHWGCKQSAGGAMLLKKRLREIGKPMLLLDGDAIDRRNCPDGQIKTRFEAFIELLEKGEGAAL